MLSILISAGWPIWPLFVISVIGLAILLERLWFLRQAKATPKSDVDQALTFAELVQKADAKIPQESLELLRSNSPLGQLLVCAIEARQSNQSVDIALEQLRDSASPIFKSFEKYLGALATIATIAPLMGLFGTVVGMIEIFGSQSGGVANPQQLAHGISVALYNTAFGLLIAIPALGGWRGLRAMADARQEECNEASRRVLKTLYNA